MLSPGLFEKKKFAFQVFNYDSNFSTKPYFDSKNKKNNKKKLAPTAVERFLIAIFDLKELYEIVPTKNLNLKLF